MSLAIYTFDIKMTVKSNALIAFLFKKCKIIATSSPRIIQFPLGRFPHTRILAYVRASGGTRILRNAIFLGTLNVENTGIPRFKLLTLIGMRQG